MKNVKIEDVIDLYNGILRFVRNFSSNFYKDITQDIYIKLIEEERANGNINKFVVTNKSGKYQLDLYFLKYETIKLARKYNEKKIEYIDEYDSEIPENEDYLYLEYHDFVKELINNLENDEYGLVFIDNYYNNMTEREIATKYNISQPTAHRIIRKIFDKIDDSIKIFGKL